MKHSIGIPLALFGLLTVAMISATSAQTADNSPGTISRPTPPSLIVDPSNPPPTVSGSNVPPAVGRYQAVSNNGRLFVIDTSTAECWSLSGARWVQHAEPINRAKAVPTADSGNHVPVNKVLAEAAADRSRTDGQSKKSATAATATLHVGAAIPQVLPSGNAKVDWNEFEAYKRNLEAAIKAQFIINAVLNDKTITDLPIIERHGAATAEWLAKAIEVDFPGNAEWMSVTIDAGDKDQSRKLVSAVVSAFMRQVVDREQYERRGRRDNLEKQLRALQQHQLDKKRQLVELSRQIGTSDSALSQVKKKIAMNELEALLRQRSEIQQKINNITLRLKLVEVLTKNAENSNNPDDAIEVALTKDQRLQAATQSLASLEVEQQEIEKVAKDKGNDPAAVRIRKAIDAKRKEIEDIKRQVRQQVVVGRQKQSGTTTADIQRLQLERELLTSQLKETASQIDAQAENIQKLEKFNGDADQLRSEIEQEQGIIKQLADELTRRNIELGADPRVRVVEIAD